MAAWNSFSYICTRALHSFRSFAHWRAASTVIPLLPKATFTPSIQPTSVSLVPVLHWLRPSTPFWPYSTHLFFPHAQTISVLSVSSTRLLHFYSSSPTHLFIPNACYYVLMRYSINHCRQLITMWLRFIHTYLLQLKFIPGVYHPVAGRLALAYSSSQPHLSWNQIFIHISPRQNRSVTVN